MTRTTIPIQIDTRELFRAVLRKGESYDEGLRRLIELSGERLAKAQNERLSKAVEKAKRVFQVEGDL